MQNAGLRVSSWHMPWTDRPSLCLLKSIFSALYRTDRNTWPAVISGSICANTELHWDPFYLAVNKQWSFFLRYTWVFFPRAQSRTLSAFCKEYAWNRCAVNDVAALVVVVALVSQVDYHPWGSHMYWFLSFTHITCPYLGFNRAT